MVTSIPRLPEQGRTPDCARLPVPTSYFLFQGFLAVKGPCMGPCYRQSWLREGTPEPFMAALTKTSMVHCSLPPPVLVIFSTRHRISALPPMSMLLPAWRLSSNRSATWNAFWSLQANQHIVRTLRAGPLPMMCIWQAGLLNTSGSSAKAYWNRHLQRTARSIFLCL